MAGTAELNVVVNLISKLKANIPGLKQDATAVAAEIEKLLQSPADAGKGFAGLFDFNGKDLEEKIKVITTAVKFLDDALENANIQDELSAKGVDFTKVRNELKGLGESALTSISPIAGALSALNDNIDIAAANVRFLKVEIKKLEGLKGPQAVEAEGALAANKQALADTQALLKQMREQRKALLSQETEDVAAAAGEQVNAVRQGQEQQTAAVKEGSSKRKQAEEVSEAEITAGKITAQKERLALALRLQQQYYQEAVRLEQVAASKQKESSTRTDLEARSKSERAKGDALKATIATINKEIEALETQHQALVKNIVDKGGDAVVKAEAEDDKKRVESKNKMRAAMEAAQKDKTTTEAKTDDAAVQLLNAWKAYETARVKITQESVNAIVKAENEGAAKVIKTWTDVQKALEAAFPKAATRQVIIEFKGKASPISDISSTITYLEERISKLPKTHKVVIEFENSGLAQGKQTLNQLWSGLSTALAEAPRTAPVIFEEILRISKELEPAITKVGNALNLVQIRPDALNNLKELNKVPGLFDQVHESVKKYRLMTTQELDLLVKEMHEKSGKAFTALQDFRFGDTGSNADSGFAKMVRADGQAAAKARAVLLEETARSLSQETQILFAELERRKSFERGYNEAKIDARKATIMEILRAEQDAAKRIAAFEAERGHARVVPLDTSGQWREEVKAINELEGRLKALAERKLQLTVDIAFTGSGSETLPITKKVQAVDQDIAGLAQTVPVNIKFDSDKITQLENDVQKASGNLLRISNSEVQFLKDTEIAATKGKLKIVEGLFESTGLRIVEVQKNVENLKKAAVEAGVGEQTKVLENLAARAKNALNEGVSAIFTGRPAAEVAGIVKDLSNVFKSIGEESNKARDTIYSSLTAIAAANKDAADEITIVWDKEERAAHEAQIKQTQTLRNESAARLKILVEEYNTRVRIFNSNEGKLTRASVQQGTANKSQRDWVTQERAFFQQASASIANLKKEVLDADKTILSLRQALTALDKQTITVDLNTKATLEASPKVPFSEGIENMKKAIAGLPNEVALNLKVTGLEKAVQSAEDAGVKVAQAQTRVADARILRESAITEEAQKAADKEIKLAEKQLAKWQKVYDEREKAASEMYAKIESEAQTTESPAADTGEVERKKQLYIQMIEARNRYNKSLAAFNLAETEAEKKKAADILAIDKDLYDKASELYKNAKNEEAAAQKDSVAGARKVAAEKKQLAKEESAALKQSLKEQKDAIADTLVQARQSAAAIKEAREAALAGGDRKGTGEAGAALDRVRREIAAIEDANRKAARAVRDGSKTMGDEAANQAKVARQRIEAELDKLGLKWADLNKVGTNTTAMWEDRLTSLSYRFSHVGFQLGIFSAGLLKAFTLPLSSAKELAKTTEYTAAILGGGSAEVEKFRMAALKLGTTTIYSSQQVAEGMRSLVQAGLNAEQAIAAVKPVLDFASAGMLEMDKAGKIAISTMNQFGLGLKDLPAITNTIAAAANRTNAEVKDFGEALKNVGPTAASVGASLKDTTVALGLLSQAGINGSMAGTQIRGVYRKLLEASSEATKAGRIFKNLGVDVQDSGENFKSLEAVIGDLINATKNMSEVERAAKVYEIFGQRAGGPAMLALLNRQIQALAEGKNAFADLRAEIEKSATAQEVAQRRGEGLWGALEQLKKSFTGLLQVIGFTEGSALKALIQSLRDMINSISELIMKSPALKALISSFMTFAAVAGGIAAVASAIALMNSALLSTTSVLSLVKRVFDTLVLTMKGMSWETAKATTGLETMTAAENGAAAGAGKLAISLKGVLGVLGKMALVLYAFNGLAGVFTMAKNNRDTAKLVSETEALIAKGSIKDAKAANELLDKLKETKEKLRKQQALSAVTFGLAGDTEKLSQEYDELKTKVELMGKEAPAEIAVKPTVTTESITTGKKQIVEFVDDITMILGNKKLGIPAIDVTKVLKSIDDVSASMANLTQLSKDSKYILSQGLDIDTTQYVKGVDALQAAYKDLGVTVGEQTAREITDYRSANEAKLRFLEDYFSAALNATQGFADDDGKINEEIYKARETAIDNTLGALDNMYAEATTKMENYAKELVAAEQELARERVDAYNWYVEQTSQSDKLKSTERQIREREEAITKLKLLLAQQESEGKIELAKKTNAEIQKLVEEQVKVQNDRIAQAFEDEKDAKKRLEELDKQQARRYEDRMTKQENAARSFRQSQQKINEQIARAEADVRDADSDARRAMDEKARERAATKQERAAQRLNDLLQQRNNLEENYTAKEEQLGDATASEEKGDRTRKELEDKLKAAQLITQAGGEEIAQARQLWEEKQKEIEQGYVSISIEEQLVKNRENALAVYQTRIRLGEATVANLQAEILATQEARRNLEITKEVMKTIALDQETTKGVDNLTSKLAQLNAQYSQKGIQVKLSATGDQKTLEIIDTAANKTIRTIPIKVEAKGADAKSETFVNAALGQVRETRYSATVEVKGKTPEEDKMARTIYGVLPPPPPLDQTVKLGVEGGKTGESAATAAKTASTEFVQVMRTYLDKDGKEVKDAFWTNFVKPGEEIVNKMSIWKGAEEKAKAAGTQVNAALAEGMTADQGVLQAAADTASKYFAGIAEAGRTATADLGNKAVQEFEAAAAESGKVFDQLRTQHEEAAKGIADAVTNVIAPAQVEAAKTATSSWEEFFIKMTSWLDSIMQKFESIKEASAAAQGGGGEGSPDLPGARYGGLVQFARGMAGGGHLPGYGGGDRHLTLLESGEYVLPKEAVRGIGVKTLNSLRALFMRGLGLPSYTVGVPRMAAGGPVGSSSSESLGMYTLNLNLGGTQYPLMGKKEIIGTLMDAMRREGMTRR